MKGLLFSLISLHFAFFFEAHTHRHHYHRRGPKSYDKSCDEEAFKLFLADHKKAAIHFHRSEHRLRLCTSIEDITKHNLHHRKFQRGVNHLSVMTDNEYKKLLGSSVDFRHANTKGSPKPTEELIPKSFPDFVDWRDKGAVGEVRDQGVTCGACWAFTAVGALEAHNKIKNGGNLVELSEQNLIDCNTQSNGGCRGGWTANAYVYVQGNNGIDTEPAYPYTGSDGTCHFSSTKVGGKSAGFVQIPAGDEEAMKKAVATIGPISVSIDASSRAFASYASGIYDDSACDKTKHNHAVLIVGYGSDQEQGDYWIVKNSWGTAWGEGGYVNIARGKNQCGIANYP
ncbi:hypothetical protein PENTCL1PPCAC_5754, partial [Pristionchus entomophagus]